MNTPKETALEHRAVKGRKMFSPSTARNRDVIRDALLKTMPQEGRILEIGAGTGEHAVHLAGALPKVEWFTGDPDETARGSIAAWIIDAKLDNLHGPHAIDVTARDWDAALAAPYEGVVSINMLHIAPFAAAEGLFKEMAFTLRRQTKNSIKASKRVMCAGACAILSGTLRRWRRKTPLRLTRLWKCPPTTFP